MWKSFRGLAAENVEKFPWEDVRRPLAATCGHSSGCKRLQVAAGDKRECWRPLAATCGHSSGCKWLQVAASGCKWLPVTENAGGHFRPLAATRVAASGCHFQNQITRLLRAQCGFLRAPISLIFAN